MNKIFFAFLILSFNVIADKFEGQGTMFYSDGQKYVGQWKKRLLAKEYQPR